MKVKFAPQKTARLLSWCTAFILVLLPFHEFLVVWLGSNTGHLDLIRIWKEILICAMVPPAVWLGWRSAPLRDWFRNSWIVRLYIIYVLLHAGLGMWALKHHQVNTSALVYALLINLRFIGFFLVCVVVAAYDPFLKRNWRKILLMPGAGVIVFGLAQRLVLPYDFLKHFGYGPKTIPAYQTVDANLDYRRVGSTLRGANPLGAYLVLIIPAVILNLNGRRWLKPLYVLGAVAALFYSYSRSAWLGLVISLGTLVYWRAPKLRIRAVYLALAAVVVLGGLVYVFGSSQYFQDTILHTSKNSTSAQSSNAARASAIKAGFRDIARQPQGRGPGTAGPASLRNSGQQPRIAEDYYLQLGQEVGVVGLGLFLAINCLVLSQLWQKRRDALCAVLLASWAGISFINLLSHAWADDTLSLLWWGLAGVALAVAPHYPADKQSLPHR